MTFPRAVGFSKEQRTRRAGNTLGHQANGWMLSGSNTSLGGRTLGQQTLFLKPAGPPEPHSHLSECRFPVWIYFRKRLPVMYTYKNDMVFLSVQLFLSFIHKLAAYYELSVLGSQNIGMNKANNNPPSWSSCSRGQTEKSLK